MMIEMFHPASIFMGSVNSKRGAILSLDQSFFAEELLFLSSRA